MDQSIKALVDQIVQERQGTNSAIDTQTLQQDVHQSGEQPGFFTRLYNEVTGDHPAPVEGVDYGTDLKPASEILANSFEQQSQPVRAAISGGFKSVFETNDFLREMAGPAEGRQGAVLFGGCIL